MPGGKVSFHPRILTASNLMQSWMFPLELALMV